MDKIINFAVVAHVDAGKSTLVDALLKQNGVFRENEQVENRVMDSGDLEKERGITITAKNCAIRYKGIKMNIVDTPGHADFSSEIERIIKTVDTVVLLVDSAEGPMPQTRFVLREALKNGLKPILFINKIDKKDARAEEVVNMTFDLFCELGADNDQLDFKIIYGIARDGIAKYNENDDNNDISPLLDTILETTMPFEGNENDPLQFQVSSLDYDNFVGRLGIGRVNKGKIKTGQMVTIVKNDGSLTKEKITKIYINEGIKKKEVNEAYYGDIVTVAGCPEISIGDTICDPNHVEPLPSIEIEKPTLSMNFLVNTSPFAGKVGKYVTSRHLRDRLTAELERNVGLEVEELPDGDGFKVSGRGELHLSILIENMRREGYELSVSKPEVITQEIDGVKCEPFEKVIINVPNDYSGTIINDISERKGTMELMEPAEENYVRLTFTVPTRGLIGYRSNFITNTKGEGIMVRSFDSYKPYAGEISGRKNGVLVTMETGKTFGYALYNLLDRGTMLVEPSTDVYEGMIVGIHNRDNDLNVNPCKNKEFSNTRSSGSDEAIVLPKAKTYTLEEALEFIEIDELVEVTPEAIRLRKKILNEKERFRNNR
ncbi:MAG: translational GTPase TypA [Bacilli bacterium]|nr:translational GTPase TypA [Bacilli bacterium]